MSGSTRCRCWEKRRAVTVAGKRVCATNSKFACYKVNRRLDCDSRKLAARGSAMVGLACRSRRFSSADEKVSVRLVAAIEIGRSGPSMAICKLLTITS